MIFFLTTQPIWVSGAIIVGLGTLLSVLGTVLVRRYANVKRLTPDTEIAGFKFGTIGVLYAVLLAFAIIVVWEKFSDAELDVVKEAGAAENIYRLSQGLSDNARAAVLRSVANYLKTAISVDWPAMDQGRAGTRGATKQALDEVYAALVSSSGQGDSTVVSEMLRQAELITQSRRARLVASEGAVPKALWPILLGGAVITIGFTFFFVTQRLLTQVLMTTLLAILILSELLIIVGIDRPFSGAVKIGPNALGAVLADVQARSSDSR
jgi:tryptophan-rich sensory protein